MIISSSTAGLSRLRAWRGGLVDEIRFWRSWLCSEGLTWNEDFIRRFDPEKILDVGMEDLVREVGGGTVRILDVGAGSVTVLGSKIRLLAVWSGW
jgi:hypothetical protein